MKTINSIIIGLLFFTASTTQAQVAVDVNIGTPNVNIHVGTPPVWGPVGYDDVDYYYLPDIQVYYDIRASQYIYFGNGRWIRSRYLPSRCRDYDLYHGYKVVLADYHGHTPYAYYDKHKVKYYKGYKGEPQRMRGPYQVRYEDRDNDHYDKGNHGKEHHDNGNHNGHGKKGHKGGDND
ncbi:hypothetical protein [Flavobacterium gilvum]|uniref:Secreted protein n=1 Tax=Flavobacterium gilvum TaxID=1492737 RepID=A0AAC9I786_9FLAO|nr:hypothetical protein [Flavobacterium gilvum]AOW10338.1 hypothetical protein EM308_12960 [Flavobacterium gilvum]KFC59767.1 hypothetical protein FEM08_14350 [Flavobacterium gilvum]